jgi:hypothetical protein
MTVNIKRVVTAVDEKGKAVVEEELALRPIEIDMMPGAEFYAVWGHDDTPTAPAEKPTAAHYPFFPGPGGTRFGLVRFPPEAHATAAEMDEAAMGAMVADCQQKLPGLIEAFEPDAPGMHTTQTVDYDLVLEGELHLELDDGAEVRLPAGSCIVQNGTRHAWHNRGDVPATLAYVIVGARPASP